MQPPLQSALDRFLEDARIISKVSCLSRFKRLSLYEYPYDHQLLSVSRLYRESRSHYLKLGGRFSPRISSTMRSLSAQDLFADDIEYTPSSTELEWFVKNLADVYDPAEELVALERFNTVSVFHEQNHRIIWRLLPPAPREERDLIRYLNFAESLVVMLDLALGDEIGAKLSPAFERMKVIYRTAGEVRRAPAPKRRDSLLAMMCATYLILELVNPEDVRGAVDYILPGQKRPNRIAVSRAFEISELFTRITNPQWQERSWRSAREKLSKMHKGSKESALYLPEDPLDFDEEFVIARHVLEHFRL